MTYKLRFHVLALKEWRALDNSIREPLKKKLAERLEDPRAPAAALHGMPDCYKIKLHSLGYRLLAWADCGYTCAAGTPASSALRTSLRCVLKNKLALSGLR